MLVDLPALDKSSQQAGTGGAVPLQTAKNGKGSDEGIIERVTQLRHQLDVQEQSFREIRDKFDYNKKFFASIPALKPMDGYYSPTGFGIRMHPVYGMYKTHVGLDIISNIGTPIYAAGDGVVEFAGRNNGGYGVMIEINHGFGYKTLYAHCSKILVKEGAKVKRGDLIAKSGKTGLVSGPHLHYEVTLRGVKQNPVDYFFDDIPPSTYNQTRRN
ncbi:MAG: M23 family metallopeptidase, partial [Ignavibacteriales bacterium]|nr:M23 family metallopeptidase [Ignavibacteriales bacterium]